MNKIHAHEVLRMMEGNSYSVKSLEGAIIDKFGEDARFHTCSAENLNAAQIIEFLTAKGKFKPTEDGFTMDITKVCSTY
ncbi:MAG: YecH family metal-binding protein [Rikenellaceae bacterium]